MYDKYVDHLSDSGVLLYPTDTLWGLGVVASDDKAIEALYEIKKRPKNLVMSVVTPSIEKAKEFVSIDKELEKILLIFWPGPVTFVLPEKAGQTEVSQKIVKDGYVGVRLFPKFWLQPLLLKLGHVITTTSANLSGVANPKDEKDMQWLLDRENVLLLPEQKEQKEFNDVGSTVLKWSNGSFQVLRDGALNKELFTKVCKELDLQSPF